MQQNFYIFVLNCKLPNQIYMKLNIQITITAIALISFAFPAKANLIDEKSPSDTLKKVELNAVVVTATKDRVNRNNVPLTISVVNREEIRTSAGSSLLPVLSDKVPGLFVTQRGVTGFGVSEGAAGAVSVRGVGQGNKVLILLDGQPQWAGIFGHALPDMYVASDVDKVEVIRGPGSLIYGSNAMGGVVNVITRKGEKDGFSGDIKLMYGSYDTRKITGGVGYKSGKFSSYLSLNNDRTNGHRENSEFNITNGFYKASYEFSDKLRVAADINLARFFSANPGKVSTPMVDNDMDIFRGSTSFALENNFTKSGGAIRLFYGWGNHRINDGYAANGGAPKDYFFRSFDKNMGVLLYQSVELFKNNTTTFGFDYKNWGGHAWNDKFNGATIEFANKSVSETALYLITRQQLMTHFSLSGGVRVESNQVFGNVLIPQLGLSYTGIKDGVIKASISKGYRSPNIKEMYMFPPQNPDLQPENMLNYELSAGKSFMNGEITAEASIFLIDGKDMIEIVKINGVPKNINTGKFINRGVEMEASWRIAPYARFDANYSYLFTSKPLLAAPKHKLYGELRLTPARLFVNLNAQYVSGLYTNTTTLAKENYTIVNSRVGYSFGKKSTLQLYVRCDNATNTNYSINDGFPMPGRTFMIGTDFAF